jgi:stage II sporulation protein D
MHGRVLPVRPRVFIPAAAATIALAVSSAGAVSVPPDPNPQSAAQASAPAPPRKAAPKKAVKRPVPRFVFTFGGRGFGHGVGMSQYGAYGAALAGRTADQIIAFYYRGTALAVLPPTTVRVLLATGAPNVRLTGSGQWSASVEGSPLQTRALPAGAEVRFAWVAPDVVVARDAAGKELLRATGPLRLQAAGADGTVAFRGVRYRGAIRLVPGAGGLTVVNHVDLERYVPGVVPREMPPQWGDNAPAALQAQAIAARSYAMATRRTAGLFDVYADQRSQVYGGASAEDPRSDQAVASTAGKVVTYGGAIVTTYFFSTSGGRTENVENVFGGTPRPYLVSVDDNAFDVTSPHHVWRDPKTFTDAQLAQRLGTKRPVLRIVVLARGVSPRVRLLRVVTRGGAVKEMRGSEVRRALGLRDTWFVVRRRVRTPATMRLVTQSLPRG